MTPRTILVGVALAGLGLVVNACAVGPSYETPAWTLPDAYGAVDTPGVAADPAELASWWTRFDDPTLTALIEQARGANFQLAAAAERVLQARALRARSSGEFFPVLDATGEAARYKLSEEAIPFPERGERRGNVYSAGLLVSWELDLFGRIRRSVEAASAEAEAAVEDYHDALVLLDAEIGRHYVDVRTLQTRMRLAGENLATQETTLELTRQRRRAGLVGDLDVLQAELNLARTAALLPALASQLAERRNGCAVLLGAFPASLPASLWAEAPIPRPPDRVLVGIPAQLMLRRPDLRRAERELAAETARIGVAQAGLYPRVSLLGSFSFDALRLARLAQHDATAFGVGPSIRWNLFDGGRVRSEIAAQRSVAAEMRAETEHTLREAVAEVESAADAFVREGERIEALRRSVRSARDSVTRVLELYRNGLADFQRVLDSQRALFEQQDELAESEGRQVQSLIALYAALGGGF